MHSDFNRESVTIAQMDGSEVTDFETRVAVDEKATTTFVEDSNVEMGTSSRSIIGITTYVEKYSDIKSFLERPSLISNGQWTTAQTVNQQLATGDIAPLLSSVTMWAEKIKGFNLIRGDFMIKVQINASPFHQGKLLLHYLPCYANFVAVNPQYGKFKNKHLTQKIQHPHIEIDCRKTSVVMRVPYVAPTQWYALKEGYYDWGTWFLDVFSPLNIGTAAPVGQQYVDFAVYAWWENVELNAPTVPQMSNVSKSKVRRKGGEVKEAAENSGPITMGLRKAGKVANALSGIPILLEIASGTEWVTNILANVTSVFGWSKPRELNGNMVTARQIFRYAGTCDGPDLAIPGGVSALNRLEVIDYGSYTNEDEMSLAFLYSVPYYVGAFTWAATVGQGTSLLSHKLSPLSFLNTDSDTVNAIVTNYEYHVPFTYLARMNKLWRGKLNLTLKFIKTQMHSGRLQIIWVPCNLPNVTPGLVNGAFNKRAIVDIRTEDTVTFELPFLLYSDYAPTTPITPTNAYSGQFDIVVLNDLRSPESCAQDIQVQWFISAGSDYELACPGQTTSGSVPYVPQMDQTYITKCQMDGGELLKSSVDQGMEMPTMEIGGVNTSDDLLFHSKRSVGERVLSIKQWLLRNSALNSNATTTFNWSTAGNLLLDPYFLTVWQNDPATGAVKTTSLAGDHLSLLGPCFAFMRGGLRYSFFISTYTTGQFTPKTFSAIAPSNGFFATSPINTTAQILLGSYNTSLNPYGPVGCYPLEPVNWTEGNDLVYQHVPYYSRLPMMLTSYYNGIDTPTSDPGRPLSSLYLQKAGSAPQLFPVVQRAVADDFQLLFFTGCPPLASSHA